MPQPEAITVRVQSRDGTKRIDIGPSDSIGNLLKKIASEFRLENGQNWAVFKDRLKKDPLKNTKTTVKVSNIKHGDLLYLQYDEGASSRFESNTAGSSTNDAPEDTEPTKKTNASYSIEVDPLDKFLEEQDGKIDRPRDPNLCRHGGHSKCVHCFPIDPFDEDYLAKREIRHMSFHAYIRKLCSAPGRSSKMFPLENITCRIKSGCKDHPPWPAGICTKCQPSAITLNRQRYRHVDNISFENQLLVNRFLDYWRRSGNQRIGFLYGKYEPHLDVPLGIKAVVMAIYEPPQMGGPNSIELLEDPKAEIVQRLADALGLCRVGWIFTDLLAESGGKVKYTRHVDSYLMSAQECITAGYFQSENSNRCKYAVEGHFGSRFVTVICTGDKNNQVHFEGYQVSNQCAALVRDECLLPTLDAPELAYVPESSEKHYVPDVYFKEKDQYGNEVMKTGRPLPVEYLIVDVPAGAPVEPKFTFYADDRVRSFPVENRMEISEIQSFDSLATYCKQFEPEKFYEMCNDFHFLLFLLTNTSYKISLNDIAPLLSALKEKNRDRVYDFSKEECFGTLIQLLAVHEGPSDASNRSGAAGPAPMEYSPGGAGGRAEEWACRHCTFHNQPQSVDCEMCGLPRA